MKSYDKENYLKKKVSIKNKNSSEKSSLFNLGLIHKIFNTINISLSILIFILSFLSFNSQRKWTNIYNNLGVLRSNNNNIIDYISKTEELYLSELESLNTFKKTTPKDLIYLKKQITKNKENYFNKKIKYILYGLEDSKYQRGY